MRLSQNDQTGQCSKFPWLVVVVVEFFFLEFVRAVAPQELTSAQMFLVVFVLKVVIVSQVVVGVGRLNGTFFDDDLVNDGLRFRLGNLKTF